MEKVVEREQLAKNARANFLVRLGGDELVPAGTNFWMRLFIFEPRSRKEALAALRYLHCRVQLFGFGLTHIERLHSYISSLKSWHIRCVCENRVLGCALRFGRERDTFSFEREVPLSWAQLKATSKQSLAQQQHWPSEHQERINHTNVAKNCITPIYIYIQLYKELFFFSSTQAKPIKRQGI